MSNLRMPRNDVLWNMPMATVLRLQAAHMDGKGANIKWQGDIVGKAIEVLEIKTNEEFNFTQ